MEIEATEQEEQKIGFKYLVIQAEVLLNPELSHTDKIVFGFVELLDGKDHCYASNEYIGRLIKTTGQTVSNSINRLIKSEYLKKIGFDGRRRILTVNEKYKEKFRSLLIEYEEVRTGYKERSRQGRKDFIINKDSNKQRLSFSKEKDANHHSQDPPNHRRRKVKPSVKIPVPNDGNGDTLRVFNHWNDKGKPLTRHGPTSKVGSAALQAIARKLNNGSNPEEMIGAMDRYYEVIVSPDTWIGNGITGHVVSLPEFFSFGAYTKGAMAKQKRPLGVVNWFDVCGSDEDLIKRFKNPVRLRKDKNPETTDRIKERFAKDVLHTSDPGYKSDELNGFMLCSERLLAYKQKVEKEKGVKLSVDPFVNGLFKCLNRAFGEEIGIGNLVSEYTITRLLPTYLDKEGVFLWADQGHSFD